ncbi:MAG: hypothetical protein R3D32_03160 [Nitratireductor sp.]
MTRIMISMLVCGAAALGSPAKAEEAGELFKERCGACHLGPERADDRVAPPIFAVKNHYSGRHSGEAAFVEAMTNHLVGKGEILMPGAVRRFGKMPDQELTLDEARQLAEFVFNEDFAEPEWFADHYRQEHGEAPKAN